MEVMYLVKSDPLSDVSIDKLGDDNDILRGNLALFATDVEDSKETTVSVSCQLFVDIVDHFCTTINFRIRTLKLFAAPIVIC